MTATGYKRRTRFVQDIASIYNEETREELQQQLAEKRRRSKIRPNAMSPSSLQRGSRGRNGKKATGRYYGGR